jgi:hypothetical protein
MNPKRIELLLKIGLALILFGSLDPMEGSILINLGSVLVSVCGYLLNKRWRWWSISATILISIGVISLWSVSALGGFDPQTEWWWLLAILPYPVGWLGLLFTFIFLAIKWIKLLLSNSDSY